MAMEVVDAHMHLWTPETHKWVAQVKDGGHPAGPFGENRLSHLLALVRLYRVGGLGGAPFGVGTVGRRYNATRQLFLTLVQ